MTIEPDIKPPMSAPAYPGMGNPCNGCGQCCVIYPCALARDLAGVREGPCPILMREGDIWRCGLTIEPHRFVVGLAGKPFADKALAPLLAEALGIGRGCDAEIETPSFPARPIAAPRRAIRPAPSAHRLAPFDGDPS